MASIPSLLHGELSPTALKSLSPPQLSQLAGEIRSFLIESVSRTGGHIGANLSTVELTIAMHRVFESGRDRILFDTGHQGYTHKIITGRRGAFGTLNTATGISRFVARKESEHDVIDASHAGTAVSLACGIAFALKQSGNDAHVVTLIGDGSTVEGMAFESLNYAATSGLRLVVLLNDNEMAIAPSVGGMRRLLTGDNWEEKSRAFFEGLGFRYLAVRDGHSIPDLVSALEAAKVMGVPVVVHAKTQKGRGLALAATHPYKMHFSMPFDPTTGEGASPTVSGCTFGSAAAEELQAILAHDSSVVVITPATPYASYLQDLAAAFPSRVIDVGMAEQHAMGMASGLALQGMKPIVCMQSTFMQRAFDQIFHDVAFMNLPVTILGVRSGFAGYDSPTHHGIYDIPYLRSIPNLSIAYPASPNQLRGLLRTRLASPTGPLVLLHPYDVTAPEDELPVETNEKIGLHKIVDGTDGVIICLGNTGDAALLLREQLAGAHGASFAVHCLSAIKPAPTDEIVALLRGTQRVVTIEESVLNGAIGAMIAEIIADGHLEAQLVRCGVRDAFIPAGNRSECRTAAGMDAGGLLASVVRAWPALGASRP